MGKAIILFHSNNHALWSAKLLKKSGIKYKLIPVPRHLSSDCGYSVQIETEATAQVAGLLDLHHVEYDRIAPL